MSTTKDVLFEERATASGLKLGVITLNIEKTLNSLNLAMVEAMLERVRDWRERSDIACLFITAAGEKAFCAGGDVQALYRSASEQPGGPCDYAERFFEQEYRLDYALHQFGKPVVVWGHGIVMGGGLGIFAAGSYRVVTEKSRLAMPEITIGLYPDVGGSYFLNRMPGHSGKFLALSGASFNAADALYVGLAEGFIEQAQRDAVLSAMSEELWSTSVGDNHERLYRLMAAFTQRSQSALPTPNIEPLAEQINHLCEGSDEQVIEAISQYSGDQPWLQKAAATLAAGSPLSARLILEQLRRSKGKSLREVFRSELTLSTQIVRGSDFVEGVRALLIDKDKAPKWRHSSHKAVSNDEVGAYFNAPWQHHPLSDL